VIVAGAGPVGLMLAGELRLGGADVTVLERLERPTGESRATQLNARTMEILDQRGLLGWFGDVSREDMGHIGGLFFDVGDVPSVHPGYWKVPQHRTEAILGDWAVGLGADLRRGHELHGLREDAGGVTVDAGGPAGPGVLRARYLVGCDGEQSTVRRLAGFGFPGTGPTRALLRADVAGIDVPVRRFERLERGLAIAGRRPDGITRLMMHEFGGPAGEGPPAFAEVVSTWQRITGEDIGAGTPVWVDVFGNASRQADRYRLGRVLLAGDAAHVQMPAGGQALNLGLQDAVNLGWKLAAEVRGDAPAGLLDSYHDERHPVGARVLTNVAAQTLLLLGGAETEPVRGVFSELLRLDDARRHLAVMLAGLDIRYPTGPGEHPLLGARMPHVGLRTGTGESSPAELLRSARGVLLDLSGGSAGYAEHRALAAKWARRVDVVAATASEDTEIEAVLLRPDGHIAWIDDLAELDATLHRWFGDPAASTAPPQAKWISHQKEGAQQ